MAQLTVIQFTPAWGGKQANLQAIGKLLHSVEGDVIVLPELCTTGYSFLSKEEALGEAEDLSGETAALFRKWASQKKAVVIAGFAEKGGGKTYNSALVAMPDGNLKVYRKTHLFFREKLCFEPGDTGFFVVSHPFTDCRIGVMVCNDWRYPEAARSLALLGADIIVCPSNLVSAVWGVAMPARALENKVYVAVANRCGAETRILEDGSEQTLAFNGGSAVYDFDGSTLSRVGQDEDGIITVSVAPTATRNKSFNAFNSLFGDRRPGLYITA